jgi:hypothetical protein
MKPITAIFFFYRFKPYEMQVTNDGGMQALSWPGKQQQKVTCGGHNLQNKGVDDVLAASDRAWFRPISG